MKKGTIVAFVVGFLMQPFWGILATIYFDPDRTSTFNIWFLRAVHLTCPLWGVSGVLFTSLATGLLYGFVYWGLTSLRQTLKKSSSTSQPS